jgi:hypothetical protein
MFEKEIIRNLYLSRAGQIDILVGQVGNSCQPARRLPIGAIPGQLPSLDHLKTSQGGWQLIVYQKLHEA